MTVCPIGVILGSRPAPGARTRGQCLIDCGVAIVRDNSRKLTRSRRYKANKMESGGLALVAEVICELAERTPTVDCPPGRGDANVSQSAHHNAPGENPVVLAFNYLRLPGLLRGDLPDLSLFMLPTHAPAVGPSNDRVHSVQIPRRHCATNEPYPRKSGRQNVDCRVCHQPRHQFLGQRGIVRVVLHLEAWV